MFIEQNLLCKNNKINSNKTKEVWFIKNGFEKEYDAIHLDTQFLPENTRLQERLYCILNAIHELLLCKTCGVNVVRFNRVKYNDFCSNKCAQLNNETRSKIKKTCLKKYGVNNPSKSKSIQRKMRRTCLERYGTESALCSAAVRKKIKQTLVEKYGVDNSGKSDSIRKKIKQTCLKKYGVEHPLQNADVLSRVRETCLKLHGVDNPGKSKLIREKTKKSYLKNFYETNVSQSNMFDPMFDKNNYNGMNIDHNFRCKECGNIFSNKMLNGFSSVRCPFCNPYNYSSSNLEKEVVDYIKSLNITNIVENTRQIIKPYELDIYLPDYNLAIEFNGLYWHSSCKNEDDNSVKTKHLNKTILCKDKNIQLLHIFENEWVDPIKRDIWKSMIRSKMGLVEEKVYARKCKIIEVDSKTSRNFLNENHLQGAINSSIRIGLEYEEDLVSLITLGKPRFNKKYVWEIHRFAGKKNTSVAGGFSRLLSHFVKQHDGSIITYADKRHSEGNLYNVAGFNKITDSACNYFYCDKNNNLHSRNMFQKHKLINLLEHFDPLKTEVENMYNNGYRRIWDCGNYVFTYQ